jgi:hypothetical protein
MARRTGHIATNMPPMDPKMAKLLNSGNLDEEEDDVVDEGVDDVKQTGKSGVLSLANLRDLLYVGKLKKEVNIAGFQFVVTTLSTRQQKDLVQKIMKADQDDRILDLKPITLSYAIESVNGSSLDLLCDDPSIKDPSDKRISVLFQFQTSLVEKLFKVYEELIESSNKEVGLEEIKK